MSKLLQKIPDQSIAKKIKDLEQKSQGIAKIPHDAFYIVRLDGRSFSKFTKTKLFNKPFDNDFLQTMIETTKEIHKKFHCVTSYTHSDEITLYFKRNEIDDKGNFTGYHLFDGKTHKILSLTASTASVYFNKFLLKLLNEHDRYELIEYVNEKLPTFDSRIIICEDEVTFAEHAQFRAMDCFRNCISSYSRFYYSAKELHKKTISEQIKMLKDKHFDITNISLDYLRGVYIKNTQVDHEAINPKTKKMEKTKRTRQVRIHHKPNAKEITKTVDFILQKYYFEK